MRVQEKGFGIKLKPYTCTEQELLEAIEKLVNDQELKERMKKISERIQTENSISKFPELVEGLVKKF
jgi:UDP:flavonoid glycosyltransferase YjiC (YdhE family)